MHGFCYYLFLLKKEKEINSTIRRAGKSKAGALSEYERLREQRMRNRKFFEDVGLGEVKETSATRTR